MISAEWVKFYKTEFELFGTPSEEFNREELLATIGWLNTQLKWETENRSKCMDRVLRLVELNVQIHQLIKEGKDEEDEGEKIRDEMDQYWHSFSEIDQEWLRQFSASLYKLWENTDDRTTEPA